MTVKIDASVIGITKPIEVATTYRAVRSAVVFQRDITQAEQTTESKNDVEAANGMLDMIDGTAKYIADTLKLTEKQADKLLDVNITELMILAREIAGGVLQADNTKPTEDDQKSEQSGENSRPE